MIKIVFMFLVLFEICFMIANANPNGFAHELMKNIKANYHAKQSEGACRQDSDCNNNNFFCKNNDCIAKRPEGSLCLSTKNEECQCGRCQLDPKTWDSMCLSFSLDGECENNGRTKYNTCKLNEDCPHGYFCDLVDGEVCKSKMSSGRLCYSDEMCVCGVCEQVSYQSRLNKPPIVYNICGSC